MGCEMSEQDENFVYCDACPYVGMKIAGTPSEEPGLCKDCLLERVVEQKKIIMEQGHKIQDLEEHLYIYVGEDYFKR